MYEIILKIYHHSQISLQTFMEVAHEYLMKNTFCVFDVEFAHVHGTKGIGHCLCPMLWVVQNYFGWIFD
jgi:hypothetical protein